MTTPVLMHDDVFVNRTAASPPLLNPPTPSEKRIEKPNAKLSLSHTADWLTPRIGNSAVHHGDGTDV